MNEEKDAFDNVKENTSVHKAILNKFSDFKDEVEPQEEKDSDLLKTEKKEKEKNVNNEVNTETTNDDKKSNVKDSDNSVDLKELERRIDDAKKWGQSKNKALLNTKKKVTKFLSKLKEDGVVPEEEVQTILESFNVTDDTDNEQEPEEVKVNPFVIVKEKLDNEFKMFKRYNKDNELEEKYNAFYSFFPMMSEQEQEESFTYLQESEPDVALDYIMTNGSEIYNSVIKGAKEKGGVLKYINSLHNKLEKLQKRSEELESELDTTTKSLYNNDTDSKKVKSFGTKARSIEELYAAKFQD